MKRIAVCTKFLVLLAIPFCCTSGSAQTCCIQLSAGASNPADHVWLYNSADPNEANLMMHVKVELPSTCSSYVDISGVRLVADGTGNDANDINWVRVDLDTGCDGTANGTVGQSAGGYSADNGTLTVCHPTSYYRLNPGQAVCYLIYYNLKSTAGCGKTYHFTLTGLMKPGTPTCQLITTPPLCAPGAFSSATKTVVDCLNVDLGPNNPANHDYACLSELYNPRNLMQQIRICNPCGTSKSINGIKLQAGGTGNDLTGVQSVIVRLDSNCDGTPDGGDLITGSYTADNGLLTLCSPTSPIATVPGNQCVCLLIYYQMKCDAPVGTYYFDVTDIVTTSCVSMCASGLPLRSAVKTRARFLLTVVNVGGGLVTSDAGGISCPSVCAAYYDAGFGVTLYAAPSSGASFAGWSGDGSGTGPLPLLMDSNKTVTATFTYPVTVTKAGSGNGTVTSDVPGINCGAACSASYPFGTVVTLTGTPDSISEFAGWSGACTGPGSCPLTMTAPRSVTAYFIESCLVVTAGSNNPPNRNWLPNEPVEVPMLQFNICNNSPSSAEIQSVDVRALTDTRDDRDIAAVSVYLDADQDGLRDPTEVLFGSGVYPVDNGTVHISGNCVLSPSQCVCLLVVYTMKPPGVPMTTCSLSLDSIVAISTDGGHTYCIDGLPLVSNTLTRAAMVGEAKCLPLGTRVVLPRKAVVARVPNEVNPSVYPTRFYVSDTDPAAVGGGQPDPSNCGPGIAVLGGASYPETGGVLVDVEGYTRLDGGEMYIEPISVGASTSLSSVRPTGMANRVSGGGQFCNQPGVVDDAFTNAPACGLNTVGKLVKLWGEVTHVAGDYCWIDDGSEVQDGSVRFLTGEAIKGIRVNLAQVGGGSPDPAELPALDDHVSLSGIMRAEVLNGKIIRTLWPRLLSDIWISRRPPPSLPPVDTFSIYTQNVFLVPQTWLSLPGVENHWPTFSDTERAGAIADKILEVDADIVILQESFSDAGREEIERILGRDERYQTRIGYIDWSMIWPDTEEDSGLAIYSKWPAISLGENTDAALAIGCNTVSKDCIRFEIFDDCEGFVDCAADKGIALVRLRNPKKDDRPLDVYFSHTQSGDSTEERQARFKQFLDIKAFMKEWSEFGVGDIPENDVIFVGDLNVWGDRGATQVDDEFDLGEAGDSDWQRFIGDYGLDVFDGGDLVYSPLGQIGLFDAWWKHNPLQDNHPTSGFGTEKRLDYVIYNFNSAQTPAMPSCVQYIRRYELTGLCHDDSWDLEGAQDSDTLALTDHYGVIATIGPEDHHCACRNGLDDLFNRADEPVDGGEHARIYPGAFEDLATPDDSGPNEAEETIAHKNGYHWFYFSKPGTYSYQVDSESAMETEIYAASDISTPLRPPEGDTSFDPVQPPYQQQEWTPVSFLTPFYVRVRCADPSVQDVDYTFRARHHDGADYAFPIWLYEAVTDTSAQWKFVEPDSGVRWYKFRIRKPTYLAADGSAKQRITIPSIKAGSPSLPEEMILRVELFTPPADGSEPTEDDRLCAPVFDNGGIDLNFDVDDPLYQRMDAKHSVVLVLKVSRNEGAFAGPDPLMFVRWDTNLKTVIVDRVKCKAQCEDTDPPLDIQDDEVLLGFKVDGLPLADEHGCDVQDALDNYILYKRFENMDVGTRKDLPNKAKSQVWNAGAGQWEDWEDETNSTRFFLNLRGLTFSFLNNVEMEFWGVDTGDWLDCDDYLLNHCESDLQWTAPDGGCAVCPDPCDPDHQLHCWTCDGNTCDGTQYFGDNFGCPGQNAMCSDDDAYQLRATWSRSNPME